MICIKLFLSFNVLVMVEIAYVSSWMDKCNSLYCRWSSKNITRLQNIQTCLTRFVTGAFRLSYVTQILKSVFWLPVNQQIFFKTLVLTYKYLTSGNSNYLPNICLCIYLLLKRDTVIQKDSPQGSSLLFLCFTNQKFMSTIVSHMTLQTFGMICHWKYELLPRFHVSKGALKSICF